MRYIAALIICCITLFAFGLAGAATKTYEAKIKLPKGGYQDVRVQADNSYKAKQLIEVQYCKGCIVGTVKEVKK